MATESPMRLVEGGGARKWPFPQDPSILGSPLKSMAAEELGMLLKGHRLHKEQTNSIPSRSGSAPPSMEGSFAAIGNLLAQQNFSMSSSFENLSNAAENCEFGDQLRSDPAYLAYYYSHVNLNPRLPPPLTSRERWRLVRHIGGFANNWRSASLDDSGNKCLKLSRVSLMTHKEEPEDDRSPREGSETCSDSSLLQSGGNTNSLVGRHKSVVDLIQEDFPRTPSPVYTQSRSSSHSAEESVDRYAQTLSSKVSSINISKVQESSSSSSNVCVGTFATEVDAAKLLFDNDAATTSFSSSTCLDETPTQDKDQSSTTDTGLEAEPSTRRSLQSGIARMDSRMRTKQEEKQSRGRNISQLHPSIQQGIPLPARVNPQGMQPVLSPAVNPPLYASSAAYMTAGTAFYPNYQPSGMYPPHYSISGYSPGSDFLPPYMTGYPSHSAIPVPFGASSGPTFDGRAAGISSGEHIPHASDLHYLGKLYSQQGLMLQPSFVDPLQLQYFQHSFGDTYGSTVQPTHRASSGSNMNHGDVFVRPKEAVISAYLGGQKVQPLENGNLGIPSPEKVGITVGSYYRGPSSMGLMTQFPSSPLMSPGLPSSPVGGMNHLGGRSDARTPQGPTRNMGLYPGGQSQRGINGMDDPKRHYFPEELKSSNARKFELSDIAGRIMEFSVDQHGSRFIQQKLELCGIEEKASVFREVLPHASRLMTDVFGNYVIQKFFDHGSPEQRKELADKLAGQILQLSLQMYGCRVIQKALEVIEHNQKIHLVQELDGHVMTCVHDQNGNHVIQKCIECVPANNIEFIISAFRGQVAKLSTHPYGCRVIQRVLERCSDELQSQCIVEEILESADLLAQDQYGNYVIQHVLERGKPHERSQIMSKLTGKIVQMSQHKYASNVVEKCLQYGDAAEREILIEEIIGHSEENDNLLTMMKDQFANYVVQKILEISNNSQREVLLSRVRVHLHALKKYTYGKHIAARFEQLCAEGLGIADRRQKNARELSENPAPASDENST